jgi:hypothetical protein
MTPDKTNPPTVFTDDDLKRLKNWFEWEKRPEAAELIKDLKALLTRLEAAERVIEAHCRLEQEKISYDNFVTLLNQWRKAAGR